MADTLRLWHLQRVVRLLRIGTLLATLAAAAMTIWLLVEVWAMPDDRRMVAPGSVTMHLDAKTYAFCSPDPGLVSHVGVTRLSDGHELEVRPASHADRCDSRDGGPPLASVGSVYVRKGEFGAHRVTVAGTGPATIEAIGDTGDVSGLLPLGIAGAALVAILTGFGWLIADPFLGYERRQMASPHHESLPPLPDRRPPWPP